MGTYAAGTDVSVERSRAELERTLDRYGADQFVYGREAGRVMIQFTMAARTVRFLVPMPDRAAKAFTVTQTGKARSPKAAGDAWEQACRQRWRALNLVIKAKLEAVDAGIGTFESEFLANVLLPNGTTVGEFMAPQVEAAYLDGTPPSPLALGRGSR